MTAELAVADSGVVSAAIVPLDKAQAAARELRRYVVQAGLTVRIQQHEYVRTEGWMFLLCSLGLPLPTIVRVEYLPRDGGYAWLATAELELNGRVYRASALCSSLERNWRDKDEYAILSMAQTRACGKVARLTVGWIMPLAGYAATPAEEVEAMMAETPTAPPAARPRATRRTQTPPQAQTPQPPQAQDRDALVRDARQLAQSVYARRPDEYRALLQSRYGRTNTADLSDDDLRDLIDYLRAQTQTGGDAT